MSEPRSPQMVIAGRKRDRPRVEPGSTVSFWIRESAHDRLLKMARDRRMTLSRFMASVVEARLR